MMRGFTLLEILASVVVLSLLSVAIMTTMRIAGRSVGTDGMAAVWSGLTVPPDRLEDGRIDMQIDALPARSALQPGAGPAVRWFETRPRSGQGEACLRLVGGGP